VPPNGAAAPRDTAHVVISGRADGDFHLEYVDPETLHARRQGLVALPWTQLDEGHGAHVVRVDEPGQHDRAVGDALFTAVPGAVLGVWTGDCAPVVLLGGALVGVAHAGWRGLHAGVIEALAGAMRSSGATDLRAVLGPCIHACCYEFGPGELALMTERFGHTVVGTTSWGTPALDVPAAVGVVTERLALALEDRSACTGCEPDRWFSHRARAERERQMTAVWLDGGR
jgi:copper oxidase (laccase) domain-containing protein